MRRRELLAAAGLAALPVRAEQAVRVGVAPGPNAEVLERVRQASGGLGLRLAVRAERGFLDDLAEGRLEAAVFADGVRYADAAGGRPLAVVAATVTLPTALYSRRLATPQALRPGDTVALPAQAPALARALVLLQNFGLVTLRDGIGEHATLRDVRKDPRGPRLVARPAAGLFASLPQVALAVIPYDEATRAGLQPARDGIGVEDARSPWAGVMVTTRDRQSEPWLEALLKAYRSEDTKGFILDRWQESVRRPW